MGKKYSTLLASYPRLLAKPIIVFLLYLSVSAIFTWPLLFKLNQTIWGNPGDNTGLITKSFTGLGLEPLAAYTGQVLSLITNSTFAFNLLTFLSFPISGLCMYLLADHVSKKFKTKQSLGLGHWKIRTLSLFRISDLGFRISGPAFISGFIFTFSPYHFWQSYNHFTLGQIQWFPLFFLALLWFLEKPNPRRGILLGLVWCLNFLTNLHYGYFTLLLAVVFIFSRALFEKKNPFSKQTILSYASFLGILGIILLWWHLRLSNAGTPLIGSGFSRPLDEIFALSARPWDYLIPAPNHFLWGNWGQKLLHNIWNIKQDYRYASPFLPERVVYVGMVPLILASLATFKIKKARPFALTAFILLLLSLPPFFDTSHGTAVF